MKNKSEIPAILLLSDGTLFEGIATGASEKGHTIGELVFNTSMTGYQEVATDPSYCGQIVCFTYPHIGNYGVNPFDIESPHATIRGIVVREMAQIPSNHRSHESFPDWLAKEDVVGIEGIDTRALTKHLRDHGVMMGLIAHGATKEEKEKWQRVLDEGVDYEEEDFVSQTSVDDVYVVEFRQKSSELGALSEGDARDCFDESLEWHRMSEMEKPRKDDHRPHVVVVDFGVKWSILRSLLARGVRVSVVPYTIAQDALEALQPQGVLISNGPGDPSLLKKESEKIREIAEKYPTFGICLGHQLLAQAYGAETYKLQFGHRGPNQPVFESDRKCVVITSQNHGYAVKRETLPEVLKETSKNLNDSTVSGLKHRELPVFSVQYHPEAGPGPNDAKETFDLFINEVKRRSA